MEDTSCKKSGTITIRISTLIIVILLMISVVINGLYIREKFIKNDASEEIEELEEDNKQEQTEVNAEETTKADDLEEEPEEEPEEPEEEPEEETEEAVDVNELTIEELKMLKMGFDYSKFRYTYNLNYDKKHKFTDDELRKKIRSIGDVDESSIDEMIAKLKYIHTGLLNFFFNNNGEVIIVSDDMYSSFIYLSKFMRDEYDYELDYYDEETDDRGAVAAAFTCNGQLKIFIQENCLFSIYHEFGHILDCYGVSYKTFSSIPEFIREVNNEDNFQLIKNNYREYALTSCSELFADTYVRYLFKDAYASEELTVGFLLDWVEYALKICNE